MTLLRSITTVGGLTMVSRILGFVRDLLIAAVVGSGPVADAFFVAFKLPNLFRRLFAEGAFNAAFLPLFAGALEQEGRRRRGASPATPSG
ncbi:MAG: lipid II flippase MurJ [Alphaproteobacteria bacterium]